MKVTLAFVLILVGGSWITATAMLNERRVWLRMALMAVGFVVTMLAVLSLTVIATQEAP